MWLHAPDPLIAAWTAPTAQTLALTAVSICAVVGGVLGRRWLPPGVTEGLHIAGLSALLLNLLPTYGWSMKPPAQACPPLTALAAWWWTMSRVVARAALRGAPTSPTPAPDDKLTYRLAYALVAQHAAFLATLLAAACSLALSPQTDRVGRLTVTASLVLLLAGATWKLLTASALQRYVALGLVGCTLRLWLPLPSGTASVRSLAATLAVVGFVSLVVVLVPVVRHWQHRRRLWQTNPLGLVEPPPMHPRLHSAVLVACLAVGSGAALASAHPLLPIGVLTAGLAALIIAHRGGLGAIADEIGLALVGETVVLMAIIWLPPTGNNLRLGLVVAAGYLLWLARFWQQQLLDDTAWTTAGRLIPAARRLAFVAAAGALALTAAGVFGRTDAAPTGVWSIGLTVGALLLLGLMFVRDGLERGDSRAALFACLALLAAAMTALDLPAASRVNASPVLLGAAAAVILALRIGSTQTGHPLDWVYDAWIGAVAPMSVALAGAWRGPPTSRVVVAAAAGALLAIGLRWRRQIGSLGLSRR